MAASGHVYTLLTRSLSDGLIDLDTDPLRLLLLSAYAVGGTQDTAQFVANVLAVGTQVVGPGYTAGGQQLVAVTLVKAGHVFTLDSNDAVWPGSTFTATHALLAGARAGSTAATQPVVCYWDFGGPVPVTASAFTATVDVAGAITWTGV